MRAEKVNANNLKAPCLVVSSHVTSEPGLNTGKRTISNHRCWLNISMSFPCCSGLSLLPIHSFIFFSLLSLLFSLSVVVPVFSLSLPHRSVSLSLFVGYASPFVGCQWHALVLTPTFRTYHKSSFSGVCTLTPGVSN